MARQQAPRLGQVFLKDSGIQRRIIEAVGLRADDVVLEIGAGPGTMTVRLAETGAKVIAVELDPKWAAALKQRFAELSDGSPSGALRVEVLHADILAISIQEMARAAGRERI